MLLANTAGETLVFLQQCFNVQSLDLSVSSSGRDCEVMASQLCFTDCGQLGGGV